MKHSGIGPDFYRHFDDKLTLSLSVEEIAQRVDALNYGAHRFLSALIRIRLEKEPKDELALGIKKLLDQGYY